MVGQSLVAQASVPNLWRRGSVRASCVSYALAAHAMLEAQGTDPYVGVCRTTLCFIFRPMADGDHGHLTNNSHPKYIKSCSMRFCLRKCGKPRMVPVTQKHYCMHHIILQYGLRTHRSVPPNMIALAQLDRRLYNARWSSSGSAKDEVRKPLEEAVQHRIRSTSSH